ncbi:MAG TPA: polysaccharide biosynthesis tyrosine autokinase [Terriglobales bacterium]|nr:polysaccharide biosynthesis tyrosine autokinase [Terriglobales bacterium]
MNSSDSNNSPAKPVPLLPAGSQLAPSNYTPKWAPAEIIDENPSFSLLDYWEGIRRYKLVILAFVIAGAMGALMLSFVQTPLYRAHTSLEVEDLNENFQNLKEADPTTQTAPPESYFQTQVKILQSREMIELVVDKLNLMQRTTPHKHFWSAWLHRNTAIDPALQREQLVDSIQKNLTVQAWGESQTAEIFYDSPDPRLAADVANTLVQTFIDESRELRWNSTQNTAEWLTAHLKELQKNLDASETKLQDFARSTGIILTSDKQDVAAENISQDKLKEIQAELSRAQADRADKQAQYETIKNAPIETLTPTLNNPALQNYLVKMADLKAQLANLSATYTPEHYKVRQVQAQIADLQKAIDGERASILRRSRDDYEAAQKREAMLNAAYSEQAKTVSDMAGKTIQYENLQHEVDTNRELYDALLLRIKQAGLAAAMRSSNVVVVDTAKPPVLPYRPNFQMNTALGLITGLFAGVGFVLMKDRFNRNIESPGLSPTYLRIPELGVIPAAKLASRRFAWFPASTNLPLQLKAAGQNGTTREHATLAEAYRATLTSILLPTLHGDGPRVLVLTSPDAGAGKTTVTSNLGMATAEIGRRVLLIDADLRRPRLHRLFEIPNSFGLTDILRITTPLEEIPVNQLVRQTKIPGLSIVPSGPTTDGLSSLLYSPRLTEFLQRVAKEFDLVLIDAPPMLHFADARVLGRHSDGVILVLRSGQTKRDAAMLARQRFDEDGTCVLGTILNSWDLKNFRSPYAYAYSDAYKYNAV